MAYGPTVWNCDDELSAEKLNKLEEGVAQIMSDYVPTQWSCDDVITAEKLNKLEQAVAEASEGGSSDFSTAEVTIVGGGLVVLPMTQEADPSQGAPAYLMAMEQLFESGTYSVPLYKGGLLVNLPSGATVSGNIQNVGRGYFITGDCTITIS